MPPEPPKDKCIIDIKNKKYLKNLNEKWPTDDPCSTEMCIYGLGGQLMIHEEIQKCDEKCDLVNSIIDLITFYSIIINLLCFRIKNCKLSRVNAVESV